MKLIEECVGQRFGRFIVLRRSSLKTTIKSQAKNPRVDCQCDCGKIVDKRWADVCFGRCISCGCERIETASQGMLGRRFSRLVVLSRVGSDTYASKSRIRKRSLYRCQCDCGTEIVCLGISLRSGNTESCGCLQKDAALRNIATAIVACTKPEGTAAKNTAIYNYKFNASERGLSWNLSDEQAIVLFTGNCFYCGKTPGPKNTKSEKLRNYRNFYRNGIDRIDNTVGYELDNCVACCWECNRMKNAMQQHDFLNHVAKIASHQRMSVNM